MNDNHSDKELEYLPRWLTSSFLSAIKAHPVVVLTGARQVGKSTFLRHADSVSGWRYRSLDDFDVLAQAEKDPHALLEGEERVILDEVQKAPAILQAVKKAVDQGGRSVRFVLSGSANLLLMRQVSESLAGRAVYFVLSPMALGEMEGAENRSILPPLLKGRKPKEDMEAAGSADPVPFLLRGFMPPLLRFSEPDEILRWWEGYVATYLERDLRQISQIDSLADFRRFMQVLALRTGQMLNQTEVARDSKISQPTIHRYLSLLEATHIVERLPVFAANRTKRLIKTPKVYWFDPALPVFLSGYYDAARLGEARERGSFFENLIFHHLRVLAELEIPKVRLSYWRTASGDEVDFVAEQGRSIVPIEVKMTSTPRLFDAAGLEKFMKEYPNASLGVLIHTGKHVTYLGRNIVGIPWTMIARGF